MEKTTISKNKTAKVGEKYSYKYTDLSQIHEYLQENNMKYYQYVERLDNEDYIMTVPIINGEEQSARRGVKIVDAVLYGVKNPAQEQGSATTYARRYSLLMAFGLATEDDDGASLTKPNTEKEVKKESSITNNQITMLTSLYTKEEIIEEVSKLNKKSPAELTVKEASDLISKKKKEK